MKYLFLSAVFLYTASLSSEPFAIDLKSQAAILYNPDNGAILYEKNSIDPYYPASITKIATAAYALSLKGDALDVIITADQESLASITLTAKKKAQYTLPAYWLETDGSHIGIKVGEQLRLKDILAGMLISSGNDAANVVAQACGNDISTFSTNMNAYLKSIGCKNTHFVNPHGLHHPDHVTTAYDMALLCKEALQYPFFRNTVNKTVFTRPKTNKQPELRHNQTNRLLRQGKLHYTSAIGVKTGYTAAAQSTLVAAAQENGRTLIAVLLKCKEREEIFKDATKLFKAAFDETPVTKVYLESGPLSYEVAVNDFNKPLRLYTDSPLEATAYPSEEPQLKAVLSWEPLTPPIVTSQKVGTLSLVDPAGKTHAQVDLLSQSDLSYTWVGWFKNLF